jgi:pimeloyl-ACP methyl ester carboxylesterase
MSAATFELERHEVNGIDTAVLVAGDGPPLVFFHGAGTGTGFDGLLPIAERFRLYVPHHPGYGESADDPRIDSINDYVLHYLDLFDALGIEELVLAGSSMGGYMAATFAIQHARRVRRLILNAPIGMHVPEHPVVDVFRLPDEELLEWLTAKPELLMRGGPPTPEMVAARYRESTSTARVFWKRVYDTKLPYWLHRLTMPTLLLWGEADRLVPVQQAATWAEHIPNATVHTLPGVGHATFLETPEAAAILRDFAAGEL